MNNNYNYLCRTAAFIKHTTQHYFQPNYLLIYSFDRPILGSLQSILFAILLTLHYSKQAYSAANAFADCLHI